MRLTRQYRQFREDYDTLDPDTDLEFISKAAGGIDGDDPESAAFRKRFLTTLTYVLQKGEFEKLPDHEVVEAAKLKNSMGLKVKAPPPGSVDSYFYYRGVRTTILKERNWTTLFLQKEVPMTVFQRLVVVFKMNKVGVLRACVPVCARVLVHVSVRVCARRCSGGQRSVPCGTAPIFPAQQLP